MLQNVRGGTGDPDDECRVADRAYFIEMFSEPLNNRLSSSSCF